MFLQFISSTIDAQSTPSRLPDTAQNADAWTLSRKLWQ
jgi:hypothetical protein